MSRILVATDFSAVADEALSAAAVLAEKLGAEVLLVHTESPLDDSLFREVPPQIQAWAQGLREKLQHGSEEARAELERRVQGVPPKVRLTARTLLGRTATEIVREAKDWKADLVVLGTHGRGAIGRAVLGSVAHEVLRTASCPVLLVGPQAPGAHA